MIQFSNLKQFNCPICSNSIVQLKRKTYMYTVEAQNISLHQIKKTKLSTVRTTLPVISNVIAEEEACFTVRLLLQPTKIIQLSDFDCYH